MKQPELDIWHMEHAIELAARGRGFVEPNPMVGCVIAHGAEIVGEGWHRRFGEAHAEIEALKLAGDRAAGATMYVTLEPCCHHGKTLPCTGAIIKSGIVRVVIAQKDPFPKVAGKGIAQLIQAGIAVEVGVKETESRHLNRPYFKLVQTGYPWVIAKWAMTLDGKTASRSGSSKWISGPTSRQVVHSLRGRVDAIMVGRGTVESDDPLLTVRPPGARVPFRVVVDTNCSLSPSSRLVKTVSDAPVLVAVSGESPVSAREQLKEAGCEVFVCEAETYQSRLVQLLDELGRRRIANVLVEGGGHLTGSLFDGKHIDEVHVFIAPLLVGGENGLSPILGHGFNLMSEALKLSLPKIEQTGSDVYIHGHVSHGG